MRNFYLTFRRGADGAIHVGVSNKPGPSLKQFLRRDNPVTLETRDASIRPRSFDVANNTIEAVVATSNPVQRRDARGSFNEVLDVHGANLDALRGASVLDAHQQGGVQSILGTVEDAWLDGDQIVARVRLSNRPDVAAIVTDIREGIIASVSVGYIVEEWRDGTDASGQRVRTAVKWTPKEISFVPVPADPRARTRSQQPTRSREIRELARRCGVDMSIADDLIDQHASVEQASLVILREMQDRSQVLSIRSAHNDRTLDNPEVFVRSVGEALYMRVVPNHTPTGPTRQYIGMTIPDIARQCLIRAGVNVMSLSAPTLIERALHTTSDFSLILADTVGRTLRDGYTAPRSGIRALGRETTATDFRKKSRLMLDSSGMTLEKVNEHGEFKSTTMTEAGESYAIDSYGRIIGFTRKALINDDLGALTDISRRFGQAAASFEAQFLVNLLVANSGLGPVMSDGNELFDAAHGNVAASGAVPSETTLSAARLAMRKQTGPDGGMVSVTPRYLFAPSEMETSCEKLLSAIQATTVDDVNPFSRLSLVIEPRLTDSKRWYLVADTAEIDGLEFAYLAGSPGPQVESKVGFEIDGVQVKVRLDFGGGFVDWRGWYSNAGQ